GLATADGDAGTSYTVLATAGSIFGSAILQINSVNALPAPVITPNGGTFNQPLNVTITPAAPTPLPGTPGWRTGLKYPGEGLEEVAALSRDGQSVLAMRARTNTRLMWKFPGVNMSPDSGAFPFYIWSLTDLSGGYIPCLFAGVTESTSWDGNNYDFYYGEMGNRVFLLLRPRWDGLTAEIGLWSCAAGVAQTLTSQNMATFPGISRSLFSTQPTQLEFSGDKVRVRIGSNPLVSATTDTNGWVTYTGDSASGRVTAPLGATRFWLSLAGGEIPGQRELVVSYTPQTTTRFTCDGSPVAESSLAVTNTLTLTYDVTLRARVFSPAFYRSAEAVATFTSNIPQLPSESYVSPAFITITHATLNGTPAQVNVDGPSGNVAGLSLGDCRYLVRYPLLANSATPLTLHRNGVSDLSGSVTWRALEIGNASDIQIRRDESLLFTAGSVGQTDTMQIVVLDSSNHIFQTYTGVAGDRVPVLFNRGGAFNALAYLNGVSIGSLVVTVAYAEIHGPIACQIGYRREKEVIVNGTTNGLFFTASDPSVLEVSVKGSTVQGVRLYLKALKAGAPVLQIRIGSAIGPIIA
ncbi:MAG: hypothetical protein WCR06_12255, partial [bacterium]